MKRTARFGERLTCFEHRIGDLAKLACERAAFTPDHADAAFGFGGAERRDGDLGGAGFHGHGHLGNQRNTDAGTDHLHEGGER